MRIMASVTLDRLGIGYRARGAHHSRYDVPVTRVMRDRRQYGTLMGVAAIAFRLPILRRCTKMLRRGVGGDQLLAVMTPFALILVGARVGDRTFTLVRGAGAVALLTPDRIEVMHRSV